MSTRAVRFRELCDQANGLCCCRPRSPQLLSAEMFGIGRDLEQGLDRGVEQHLVDGLLVD